MRRREHSRLRKPKSVILVICEGETEAAYVELLRRHYRLPITIKSKVIGNKVNSRLINRFLKDEGLNGIDDTRIIYMYDADVEPVVEKLKDMKGLLVLSNPCIELWFLLHQRNHSKATTSKELQRILESSHPLWVNYSKGILNDKQKELLIANRGKASERAKALDREGNPSTNMYQFIELLESEKTA